MSHMGQNRQCSDQAKDFHFDPESGHLCLHLYTPSTPVVASARQSRRVQSLRDIRDQIGRMFDADRQADRGVENAYLATDVAGNAGVGHACGQARKRFRPAKADRKLEDLQRVQKFEGGRLAANDVE